MKLNRRSFIKSSSVFLGGLLLQGHKPIEQLLFDQNNFRELRNTIGIYNERGGTIGWYVNDDMIVVIDSQFPDTAKNFKKDLNSKSIGKIDYLINTHHHNDHTLGNFYLKDFTENIVAHENCTKLQLKHNKGKETENQVVTANTTFNNKWRIKLPDEYLTALHFGKAHTGGDIIIHFENSNIVHLGDLVFNNVYPYIDNPGECKITGWVDVLDKILNYSDKDAKFIFGHANSNENVTGSKTDLIKMRDYLNSLIDYVTQMIKEGKTADQIAETNTIPRHDSRIELWKGARKMNLKAVAEQILN
jgi:glyoxylase-like metal-dependent hydrolase (beta-lactamase superfamily II)